MYVAAREKYGMKPPTIIVPNTIKDIFEGLFEVYRELNESHLRHNLTGLNPGEEFQLRRDLKVKAFRTCHHVIASQGYVVYSVKQKLKKEYVGLPGKDIKQLKFSGVEITEILTMPVIAFTGDTKLKFICDGANSDAWTAKILVMESTFVDDAMTVKSARDYGHTHLSEIVSYKDIFKNKAILRIHFSARYRGQEIEKAVSALPSSLAGLVFPLTEGF